MGYSSPCTLLEWQDYQDGTIPIRPFPYFDDLANINVLITVFALVAGAAQLVFLYNFIHSMFYGKEPYKTLGVPIP